MHTHASERVRPARAHLLEDAKHVAHVGGEVHEQLLLLHQVHGALGQARAQDERLQATRRGGSTRTASGPQSNQGVSHV